MAEIILITGGSRSGKSAYAQKLAEALPGPRAYVATCPVIDPEMELRVKEAPGGEKRRRLGDDRRAGRSGRRSLPGSGTPGGSRRLPHPLGQ